MPENERTDQKRDQEVARPERSGHRESLEIEPRDAIEHPEHRERHKCPSTDGRDADEDGQPDRRQHEVAHARVEHGSPGEQREGEDAEPDQCGLQASSALPREESTHCGPDRGSAAAEDSRGARRHEWRPARTLFDYAGVDPVHDPRVLGFAEARRDLTAPLTHLPPHRGIFEERGDRACQGAPRGVPDHDTGTRPRDLTGGARTFGRDDGNARRHRLDDGRAPDVLAGRENEESASA